MKYLKTSDIAKAFGLHPNTIRLYEAWNLLPAVPRSPAGYRLFTQIHLDQVKLIRLVFKCTMFGKGIKSMAYQTIHLSAEGSFDEAVSCAKTLRDMIQIECRQAEEAERFLEQWATRAKPNNSAEQCAPCGEPSSCLDHSTRFNVGKAPEDITLSPGETVSSKTAAKILDITMDTLRNWERNNLIHIPRHPSNGYRLYGCDEINKLRVIRVLRRSNYSNMAILRAMQKLESGSAEGLREALDSPDLDEERGYLCFTDTLLTALYTASSAIEEVLLHFRQYQIK